MQTGGDARLVITRRFAGPPEAVYRAHPEPELIRQWMLGPEGWTMPVCISEATPGGSYQRLEKIV
ncbi:MAG: SRPBCC domain-containing protein [Acidobacteriaceae bacterium]|nr:SRPBCC domain-containing protein [Acidobacteriaceae bacterium]